MVKLLIAIPVILFILALASHALFARSTPYICTNYEAIPFQKYEYAIVFGAGVASTGELSDIVRERDDAAIALYQQDKVEKLYVSGDNRHFYQAQTMAEYAIKAGVSRNDVIVDKLGIDTHDTCRHFANDPTIANDAQALLVTQEFHLPRAMLMCRNEGVTNAGLAVNQLGLLEERASSPYDLYITRSNRFLREAALTWMYRLGIYDFFSVEAEKIEENNLDPATNTLSYVYNQLHDPRTNLRHERRHYQ